MSERKATWAKVREGILWFRDTLGDDHISDKTATAAMEHAVMLEAIGAAVPEIWSHGGDAMVFTWQVTPGVRDECFHYTICEDDTRKALHSLSQPPRKP